MIAPVGNFFFDGQRLDDECAARPLLAWNDDQQHPKLEVNIQHRNIDVQQLGYASAISILKRGTTNTGTPEWSCLDVSDALADDHILFFRGGEGR